MKALLKKSRLQVSLKRCTSAIISLIVLANCSANSPSPEQVVNQAQKAPMKKSAPTTSTVQELLIGTYTDEGSKGVYKLTFSPEKNQLVKNGLVAKAPHPAYLAQTTNNKEFYSIVGKKNGGMSYYQWHEKKQRFVIKSQLARLSQGACHIALNPQNTQAAVADYATGEVHLVDLNTAEKQKSLILRDSYINTGSSITPRQKSPHSHYVQWDRSGKFLYAVDLGTDEILLFTNTIENKLSDKKVAAKLAAGDGPRHMVFHPNKAIVYVVNELSNVVAVYAQNQQTGVLNLLQRVSALTLLSAQEQKADIANFASAIKISNDARFIYAAIRGINKIAVFSVANNGELELLQLQSTLGNWPRDITLSAEQDYLFIANKLSNDVTALKRDENTGLLSATTMKADVPTPAYIGLL